MEKTAANGNPLDVQKKITQTFYDFCGIIDDRGTRVPTEFEGILQDVQDFSNLLAQSMGQEIKGDHAALETFEKALKLRSSLMSNPAARGQTHDFLNGVLITAKNGDPAESLKLTVALHANMLDPRYKGEEPKVEENTVTPQPIL